MPQQSNIEWCDATWNPVTGCSKVSQGCKNCYAEAYFARPYPGRKFTDVRIHPERLDWPLRWRGSPQAKAEGRPSRIFVNSMSDLFHEDVEFRFIRMAFRVMGPKEGRPNFIFQVLTKRPDRMLEFFRKEWTDFEGEPAKAPTNVWLGVSVEDQKTADERIPLLLRTPAAVRWVSYEPALGPVDFRHVQHNGEVEIDALTGDHGIYRPLAGRSEAKLDWIVAGGESGPRARPPHPDWFRSVRDQCAAAGVPFFFKQWGAWKPVEDGNAFVAADGMSNPDGYTNRYGTLNARGDAQTYRNWQAVEYVGKKNSGRLLDGREHNEFPPSESSKL